MTIPESEPRGLKHKARRELAEYLINAGYLAFFFVAFTNYRRLLLAAHDIAYTDYWMPLVQALILGKVVTIGSLFRLGRSLEHHRGRPGGNLPPLRGSCAGALGRG